MFSSNDKGEKKPHWSESPSVLMDSIRLTSGFRTGSSTPQPQPEPERKTNPGELGVAATGGREGAVQPKLQQAYDVGNNAPQSSWLGDTFRAVGSRFLPGIFDHTYGSKSGGRYNHPGTSTIYNSPSESEAIGENNA